MPLVIAPVGKELKIIKVLAQTGIKKHLENLGIIAGGKITIISICDGSVICLVKDGRIALDKGVATKIFVQEEAWWNYLANSQ